MSAAAERKPTPGPWKLEGHWKADSKKLGGWVSTIHPSPLFSLEPITGTPANIIANANLIAAAPELLAALKYIRDMPGPVIDGPTGPCKFLAHPVVADVVNEAIAKAEAR